MLVHVWRPRRDLNPCYRRESGSEGYLAGFALIRQNSAIVSIDAGLTSLSPVHHLLVFGAICQSLGHHSVTNIESELSDPFRGRFSASTPFPLPSGSRFWTEAQIGRSAS